MSVYRSYKTGSKIPTLVKKFGNRRTYNALKKKLTRGSLRIKHNKLQVLDKRGVWKYVN